MIFFIFPNQLFYNNFLIKYKHCIFYIIEEPRYFTDFSFHKLKLAYHRASMKKYYDYLKSKKFKVIYIEFNKVNNTFYKSLKNNIYCFNTADHTLHNKLTNIYKDKIIFLETLNFLIKNEELDNIKSLIYKNNSYSHEEFYKYQRKKLDILITNLKPEGGKWSFDNENRLSLPKNIDIPNLPKIKNNKYIDESINYINKHFPNNYGLLSTDNFIYPIDKTSSIKWLNNFLKKRLYNFGPYEDAVSDKEPFIFHSVLSPMMNIGILTDEQVIKISYKYYLSHKKNISIQSFEGFIRQVIGWRNYVYTLYLLEGEHMIKMNYLKHSNEINKNLYKKLWEGNTGIEPIDGIINKIIKYSYAHHIERLMYLGNFLLLCQIKPIDIYKMFMEWTIDAYDWVMVPNVFGMSQFATNKLMMTRPYFSSSNYILKMSDYKKGDWCEIWDNLYYYFIYNHKDILKKIYATSMQVKHWDNKTQKEKDEIIKNAKSHIKNLIHS
jgi:deoxyribodipyrimidine photolyase-related protein